MKSKVLKCMALACTLAFMNCDDSTSVSTDVIGNDPALSSAAQLNPAADQGLSSSSVAADANAQAPASSDANASVPGTDTPAPGTDVAPASSDASASAGDTPASSATDASAQGSDAAPASSSAAASAGNDSPAAAASSASEEKTPEVSSSSEAPKPVAGGVFLASGTEEEKDQMEVEFIEHTGHDGGAILAYPKQLSSDKKHAIVVWGPGGGTEPGAYGGMIHRLASHGFVVIALSYSPGDASQATPALDWLAKKNETQGDPLYQKLDMNKVGCSGHSMGGLESEQALIKDSRVITAIMNNSGDLGHSAMSYVSTEKTIAIVYGNNGMERPNAEADYGNGGVKAPACLIMMEGADWGHGSGPWGGMAATVAWMRWHLGGEDNRKADFVGSSGKYINGNIIGGDGNWNGKCKNF